VEWIKLFTQKQKQTEKQLINQEILKIDLQRDGQSKERSSDEKIWFILFSSELLCVILFLTDKNSLIDYTVQQSKSI
jgi:hypothetical protein